MKYRRFAVVLPVLLCLLGVVHLESRALAAGDERRATETTLAELEQNPAHKALTEDFVKRSREATERAVKMRAAGDEPHALLLDGLAHSWAEAGKDLVRAASAEGESATARRNATDAGAHAERERALLEEGIAQNGRLRAQLDAVERESKQTPTRTAAVAAAVDGGAPARKAVLPSSSSQMTKPPPPAPNKLRKDGGAP